MLAKKNPFTSFDTFFEDVFDRLNSEAISLYQKKLSSLTYLEDDGSFCYTLDLPGVKQENLTVEVLNKVISVKAERKTKVSSYSATETMSVPDNFDTSKLSAELSDGVLTIKVPPADNKKMEARKIDIKLK